MSELTALKGQRNAVQANARKEFKKIPSFFPADSPPKSNKAKACLIKLQNYLDEHNKLSSKIAAKSSDDEVEDECLSASEFQDTILDHIAELTITIQQVQTPPPLPANGNAGDSSVALPHFAQMPNFAGGKGELSVKLPKLELEKFDGDPIKWEAFWDGYRSTIHDNKTLSQVDKFKYLKSYLEGDALRMVSGYQLTNANYDTVIQALEKRFGNKDFAINAHIEAMLALPQASHSTASLQATFQECETHIRSLVAHGLSEDTFGQIFTPIILSKLPKFVRLELHRENQGNPWTLTNLRKLLQREIYVREMSDHTVTVTQQNGGDHKNPAKQKDKPRSGGTGSKSPGGGTASALVHTNSYQSRDKQPLKCCYCGEAHHHDECAKFPDAASRRERIKGSCYKCLRQGHNSRNCKSKPRPCAHCQGTSHHRSLCSTKFGSADGKTTRSGPTETSLITTSLNPTAPEFVPTYCAPTTGRRTVLQTAVAAAQGSCGRAAISRLLLDTASCRSYITAAKSKEIRARKLGTETISVAGFGATERNSVAYKKVAVQVKCKDGSYIEVEALECPTISLPIPKTTVDSEKFPVVKQVLLADPQLTSDNGIAEVKIDILVGGDHYYDFVGSGRMEFSPGLFLLESKLGFILAGRMAGNPSTGIASSMLITEQTMPGSEHLVDISKYWDLEEIGIKDDVSLTDDDAAMQQYLSTVRMNGNRYAVTWPWKHPKSGLPDNFALCLGQLRSLRRRLKAKPALLETYDASIQEQLKGGIIENSPSTPGDAVHYLPHHAVLKPDKSTTKVRIVHNASAKSRKDALSLNDCLFRGPLILSDMCGILLRFRFWPVAFCSDIEKAFLQIELQEHERDVVRFLWVRDFQKPPAGDNLVSYRFCRVPFGVVSSPFLLAATVRHHTLQADTRTSRDIAQNTYVDNTISGCKTTEEAVKFYQESKHLFNSCSMNLREWSTNNPDFLSAISEKDRAPGTKPTVLGLTWDTDTDTISCPTIPPVDTGALTKRQMLQNLAKLYDPCGLFSAVSVTGKILMQRAWVDGTDWDEPLSSDLQQKWSAYQADHLSIPSVPINRWCGNQISDETSIELHTFCDASALAYAAVSYVRIQTGGSVRTNLVLSKTRVRPLKDISIPRLELMAAVVGVRLTAFVAKEMSLRIDRTFLWSDSKCVLHWIVKKQMMPVFVENRLKEIRQHRHLNFRHVPTEQNPADLASRGCPLSVVQDSSLWWQGPAFLQTDESSWPEFQVSIEDQNEEPDSTAINLLVPAPIADDFCIKVDKFSHIRKLVSTTAWVLRFIGKASKRCNDNGRLSPEEYDRALSFLIKRAQVTHFPDLLSNKPQPALVRQLNLFEDEQGIIRSQGRLLHANLPADAKTPILLPKEDHLTRLLIEGAHRAVAHAKTSHTLAELRTNYWVPQGRSVVRKVVRQCRVCRRNDERPFVAPNQPPLPTFRVRQSVPFQALGIDYLGPLYVKGTENSEKVWICLFTCAAIRAVHLEVVESMTTEHFIMCLRRFVARYGRPTLVISDNAPQFKQADKVMKLWWRSLQEDDTTQEWATQNRITWKFVPEMAPWMGGFYERLVGLTKNALKKTLERRRVTLVELQTVTAEIAAIINTRPITYFGDDTDDQPLTPSHFLAPLKMDGFPSAKNMDPAYVETTRSGENVVLSWRRSQALMDSFWYSWHHQYLLSLRERAPSQGTVGNSDRRPQLDTVVLIKDPNQPRGTWKLGKIIALHQSFDGQVRSATVRTDGRPLVRPLKLLIPLEFTDFGAEGDNDPSLPDPPVVPEPPRSRPRRAAASNAAEIVRGNWKTNKLSTRPSRTCT